MDYGKKISALRKSKGMTQEELGRVLNVTYQAVSKWERGESLPDFTTMSQIAKFFQVPLEYFEDGYEDRPEPVGTENGPVNSFIGMCTECGKMLKENEVFSDSPKIVCNQCAERRKKEEAEYNKKREEQSRLEKEESKRLDEELKRQKERAAAIRRGSGFDVKLIVSLVFAVACFAGLAFRCFTMDFAEDGGLSGVLLFVVPLAVFGCVHALFDFINDLRSDDDDGSDGYKRSVSFIVAAAFALINGILFLVLYSVEKENFYMFLLAPCVILSFTFVSQFMWGGIIHEMFTAGGFTFKLPGFIFSLTLDSILWMIVTKIFLGIVSVLVFVVTTVVLALVAIIGSFFSFIPSMVIKTVKDRKA